MLALRRDGDVFTAPFNRLANMNRELDSWFGGVWPEPRFTVRNWVPPMDVEETAEEIRCTLELPGIDPSQIDITVERDLLTISGERQQERGGDESSGYHLSERWFGRFTRSFRLPAHVDANHVTARYEHGLLYIVLPKTEEARARRIEIQAVGAERQLTSSTE